MRKEQKEQLVDFIKLVDEAHKEIKKNLEKKNFQSVLELLENCQNGAIAIGNLIEKTEGAEFVTIPMLEQYCELVYQIYETVAKDQIANFNKIYKDLNRLFIQIENSINNDIKVCIEIAFLPYKASMWDSMESIWLAMKDDPGCNAVVIPIPYYDLNKDGTYGEFHYEAEQLPDYVSITKYDEYNFEEKRPDIIFIHNPYDECNLVTRVHPFFFSKNIKKYTNKLIYVPYFITGGYMSDSFYALPAYIYADYIITQSDNMKSFYAPQFQGKLLPLGSPKADRVLNDRCLSSMTPMWKEKIANKKVFLYNTSISGILQQGQMLLDKMKYVFECFKNSDNAIILWRPHPLMYSTLKSMRPQLLPIYEKLVEEFLHMDNAIYDDNPDDTLAVRISDAYIGESTSSMVCLFGIQGKPIFLTNTNIELDSLEAEKNIYAYDCVEHNDNMWILSGMDNYLYSMSKSGQVNRYQIPDECVDGVRLYNEIVVYENKLILVPYRANEIAVFDTEQHKFQKIKYDDYLNTRFVHGVIWKNYIYMIPSIGNHILKINTDTYSISYDNDLIREIVCECNKTENLFFNGIVQQDNMLFIASCQTNKVLIINLEKESSECKIVGEPGDNYWTMCFCAGSFWLASNEGRFITKWNYETGEWKKLESFPEEFEGTNMCFEQLISENNTIYSFTKNGTALLKINALTDEISIWNISTGYSEGSRKNSFYNWVSNYYFARKIGSNKIICMTAYDHSMMIINIEHDNVDKFTIKMEVTREDYYKRFRRESPNIPLACKETRSATLKQYMEICVDEFELKEYEKNLYAKEINNMDGTCGLKIKDFLLHS